MYVYVGDYFHLDMQIDQDFQRWCREGLIEWT